VLALVNTPDGPAPVELREIPDPLPASNEALVEVQAFSLNRGELASFARNKQGWVPGQDISGTVLRRAANGAGPAAGARVVALVDEFGWAQRAAVPAHRMAVLPDTVSFAQAATLPVAGLTALRTLRHGGALVGRRVLITGAAGGVGTLAVQIAAASGAQVTAVVGRAERAGNLRQLGAADVAVGDRAHHASIGILGKEQVMGAKAGVDHSELPGCGIIHFQLAAGSFDRSELRRNQAGTCFAKRGIVTATDTSGEP